MTRINAGIDPATLTDKHLMAEHREMKRIPNCIAKGRANLANIPPTFRLGKGHVSFFYDKLGFLHHRYKLVHAECLKRGFNVQDYSGAWDNVPARLMGDWVPSVDDSRIVQERIDERLLTAKRSKLTEDEKRMLK